MRSCVRLSLILLLTCAPAAAHAATPNDPRFGEQWAFGNTGQSVHGVTGLPGIDGGLTGAWDFVTGGDTVVAIAGTGVSLSHPDLQPNLWTNPGETGTDALGRDRRTNGVDDDGNSRIDDWRGWDFQADDNDPSDANGYGTEIAGIVGASGNDGVGVTGVNWRTRIMPLKVGGSSPQDSSTNTDSLTAAMLYAGGKGAKIFLAPTTGTSPNSGMEEAIVAAPNTLFVFPAGDSGTDNDTSPRYPCAFNRPNVLCVTALSSSGGLPTSANRGLKTVDLAAPGVDLLTTSPFRPRFDEPFEQPLAGRWTVVPGLNGDVGWGLSASPAGDGTKALTINGNESPVASSKQSALASPRIDLAGCPGPLLRGTVSAGYTAGSFDLFVTDNADSNATPSWRTLAQVTTSSRFDLLRDLTKVDTDGDNIPDKDYSGKNIALITASQTGVGEAGRGPAVERLEIVCTAPDVFTGQEHSFLSGTGAAAATVAGAAALVASQYPAADMNHLRTAILGSVTPMPSLASRTVTGGRLYVRGAIDTSAPAAFAATAPADGTTTTDPRPAFTFGGTTDDKTGIARYELVVDGQVAGTTDAAGRTIQPAAPLSLAAHSWRIEAVDGAGLRTATPARTITVTSAAAPPRDTKAPTIKLGKLKKITRKKLAKDGFTLSCDIGEPGTCGAEVRVSRADAKRLKLKIGKKAKTLLLARVSKKTASNGKVTLRLKPKASYRRAMGRARRKVTYRFTVTAKDTAGNAARKRTASQKI